MSPENPDSNLEYHREGLKNSLICVEGQELKKGIATILRELEFNVHVASSAEDTFDKIKYNQYECIVLNDTFSGSSGDNNEVLEYIQSLPIPSRRQSFVVLIGKNYRSSNNMAALSKSVNLVFNEQDLSRFKSILKSAMEESELFYRVYKKVLVEFGKG